MYINVIFVAEKVVLAEEILILGLLEKNTKGKVWLNEM